LLTQSKNSSQEKLLSSNPRDTKTELRYGTMENQDSHNKKEENKITNDESKGKFFIKDY